MKGDHTTAAPPSEPRANAQRAPRPERDQRVRPDEPMLFSGAQLRADWPFGSLAPSGYDLIMADPPWLFDLYSAKGEEKSAQAQYGCMTDAALMALPVGELAASNCLLWLWSTWPKLPVCMAMIARWGFTYKTGGAWNKKRWGTGYLVRSRCEPFLLATRGSPSVDGRSVANLIDESRREHSRKPEAAYSAATRMMPTARRLELFSRESRPGWDTFGNEAGKFDAAVPAPQKIIRETAP